MSYSEYKVSYTVYYIDFTLLCTLSSRFKREFVFHCQMFNDILCCDRVGNVMSCSEIKVVIVTGCNTSFVQYFTGNLCNNCLLSTLT